MIQINRNKYYLWLLGGLMLGAVSCEDNSDSDFSGEERIVNLITGGVYEREDGGELTRALPTGYVANSFTSDPGNIAIFMTQTSSDPTITSITGVYRWKTGNEWTSNVAIRYDVEDPSQDHSYYVYGYMPRQAGISPEISATDSRYDNGATMTLKNASPVTAQDMCIITGVLTGVQTDPATTPVSFKPIDEVDVKVGYYQYNATETDNGMYLIFDHVFSKMTMKMQVDESYNEMRTIKVTKMAMTGSSPSINIQVVYTNNGSAPTVTVTQNSDTYSISEQIFNSEKALTTSPVDLTSFYCADVLTSVTLTTTFDVYDKEGNKLRSNCSTSNTIHISKMEAGKSYTLTATIKPTYLYQLSETDLDQPTVEIN